MSVHRNLQRNERMRAAMPARPEAEVAHLVMRGLTTKDIAATLSRAPSTIDFHRHNIRDKLGVARGVTLRAYLLSIR